MHLLIGIDTEGDNQWSAAARANQTFENIYALPKLHALFQRHRVRPTYVITYPVATDRRSAEVLRGLLAGGDCEIGSHHHAWETPPCTADDVRRHPYASTLPLRQFEAQLEALTGAITGAVGVAPVSYRSGRFGFSPAHVAALERLEYRVESSVAPLFYEAHKGGPDFVEAPLTPYFLAYDAATRPGTSEVLEAGVVRLEPADPQAAPVCLRGAPGRTPPSACCGPCGSSAWLRPSARRSPTCAIRTRPRIGRRTGPEPALPLERGDRRRQPLQSHHCRARGVLRSARAVPDVCRGGTGRHAGHVRGVSSRVWGTGFRSGSDPSQGLEGRHRSDPGLTACASCT